MTTILITAPIFAIIACGFMATHWRIINSAGRAGLNTFVYYFALPAVIFSLVANADLRGQFEWIFVIAFVFASLALFSLSLVVARKFFKLTTNYSIVFATACVYGNTGYFGLPFAIIALGQETSVVIVLCTATDLVVMLSLATILLERSRISKSATFAQMVKGTTFSIVKNPIIVSVVAGILVSISGVQFPEMGDRFFQLLGTAAAPCALFALGSSVGDRGMSSIGAQTFMISFLKLTIHPILVWFAMFHLFPVDPKWATAAVVAAAMPVAVTVYILAKQFDTYSARCSASILVSTVLSLASLSAVLYFLI